MRQYPQDACGVSTLDGKTDALDKQHRSHRAGAVSSWIVLVLHLLVRTSSAAHFTSHVSVNTPARSFTHGVGDVTPSSGRQMHRAYPKMEFHGNLRNLRVLPYTPQRQQYGYPKEIPTVPFYQEEISHGNSLAHPPWHSGNFNNDIPTIPVLPASPYRVNSPNPESLWPEGLFVPPMVPLRGFGISSANKLTVKSDDFPHPSENEIYDPYLLEDAEALRALESIKRHGELFFDDIPHHRSLLENQQMRIANNVEPHRLGSIRHSWIYHRP